MELLLREFRTLASLAFACTVFSSPGAESTLIFTAPLRTNANVDIVALVLENPSNTNGSDVICLHGLGHRGDSFRRLANSLFVRRGVHRVVSLNLPGRGGSGVPYSVDPCVAPPLFGELGVLDYAHVFEAGIVACWQEGIPVTRSIEHSMGGIITQVAEDELAAEGLSLTNLGIEKFNLISSSPSKMVANAFVDSGLGVVLVDLFANYIPGKGRVVIVPPNLYAQFFFSFPTRPILALPSGIPALDAPILPGQAEAWGLPAVESYTASMETVGPPADRPSIQSGIFSPTNLRIIIGIDDAYNSVDEQKNQYLYLTGDTNYTNFKVITKTYPVHDQYVSEPDKVADELDL